MSKFCSNCGAPLGADMKFCGECGKPVSSSVISANLAPAASTAVSADSIERLQAELYSLYRILEPVKELDLAGRAIADKTAELSSHQPETDAKFHTAFVHYMPFINAEIPEDLIVPEKVDKKTWKNFMKQQKKELSGSKKYYYPTYYQDLYRVFRRHEAEVLQNVNARYLYYKMQYCFDYPPESRFWKMYSSASKKSINTRAFDDFLKEKLGDKRDEYIVEICTKLKSGNRGHAELCDELSEYEFHEVDGEYDYFFKEEHGFPPKKRRYYIGNSYIETDFYNFDELDAAGKATMRKAIHTKKELDASVAELKKVKGQIDAKIDEYMENTVDEYIAKNVKTVPVSYAKNWESVAYFLYLIVNKRGRDIYEVINQYEVDMKHKELTSALADISTEINSQTNILAGKLDEINRSIISMASAITSAISCQTRTLQKSLDSINYSVMATGASVAGAISGLGASMGQAMSNMKVRIS